ncbi:hypothetical protein RBB50_009126 [Rhinocladiella similis]
MNNTSIESYMTATKPMREGAPTVTTATEHANKGISKSKKKIVFIWSCCKDGKSAISIKAETCPSCTHARCNKCKLQKITQ